MNQPAPEYRAGKPFSAHFDGCETVFSDSANAVTVEIVTGYNPNAARSRDEDNDDSYYADGFGHRELVKIDTNYKPTRPGEHPVCLTRADAVGLAAALLEATPPTTGADNVRHLRRTAARHARPVLQQPVPRREVTSERKSHHGRRNRDHRRR